MRECVRCSSDLFSGFCLDETCPFHDHVQDCIIGWYGHPEHTTATKGHKQSGKGCKCSTIKPVLAKTILKVEILHSLAVTIDGMSLEQIHNECMDGDWSMIMDTSGVLRLNKKRAIAECHKQGTDPEFFGIEDTETHLDEKKSQ